MYLAILKRQRFYSMHKLSQMKHFRKNWLLIFTLDLSWNAFAPRPRCSHVALEARPQRSCHLMDFLFVEFDP